MLATKIRNTILTCRVGVDKVFYISLCTKFSTYSLRNRPYFLAVSVNMFEIVR